MKQFNLILNENGLSRLAWNANSVGTCCRSKLSDSVGDRALLEYRINSMEGWA
jgi:hypothetical protein